MMRLVFSFLCVLFSGVTTVSCGGSDKSSVLESTRGEAGALEAECEAYCYRFFGCFEQICHADYPGSDPGYTTSALINDCIDATCGTDRYMHLHDGDPGYLACARTMSCRGLMTGSCGDVVTCTSDPTSTPFLPGTKTPAPLPTSR